MDQKQIEQKFLDTIAEKRQSGSSRRSFISTSAFAAGGAALAFAAGPAKLMSAQDDGEDIEGLDGLVSDFFETDIDVLNYALTLEHLEATFYREALAVFVADDLPGGQISFELITEIGAHEAAHVVALSDAIVSLGGEPVSEATYDFGYTDAIGFLEVGVALEDTGVAAYAGAAPALVALTETPALVVAALGIHSVEARHASFLRALVGTLSPFPDAVDAPLQPEEVLEIAGPFIVSAGATTDDTATDDDAVEDTDDDLVEDDDATEEVIVEDDDDATEEVIVEDDDDATEEVIDEDEDEEDEDTETGAVIVGDDDETPTPEA